MVKTVIGVSAASLATAAAAVTLTITAHQRGSQQMDINRAVCTAVVRLDEAISDTLRRSLVNIPKLDYYKQHPADLARQERDIRETLKKFVPPPECNKNGAT